MNPTLLRSTRAQTTFGPFLCRACSQRYRYSTRNTTSRNTPSRLSQARESTAPNISTTFPQPSRRQASSHSIRTITTTSIHPARRPSPIAPHPAGSTRLSRRQTLPLSPSPSISPQPSRLSSRLYSHTPPNHHPSTPTPTHPTPLDDSTFQTLSESYLQHLLESLEALADGTAEPSYPPSSQPDSHAPADDPVPPRVDLASLDPSYSQGVMTLRTSNGTYVINKQPPNRQIWLSSPVSGPKRYDWVSFGDGGDGGGVVGQGGWVYLRDGSGMSGLLREELGVDLSGWDAKEEDG